MFGFRVKKSLSVILSSCTLGVLSSFLTCQLSAIGVSVNEGELVRDGVLPSESADLSSLEQTNDGDIVVGDPEILLDGYILKGNVINYGDNLHLVTYDSVPPLDCDLYVRAIKIKDGFGNDVKYDPNTSDVTNDSGWLKYEGRATFDYLASTTGLWHTYAVRYKDEDFTNDYDVKYIILDQSRSMDGINRYTLLDSNHDVVVPNVEESDGSSSESSGD